MSAFLKTALLRGLAIMAPLIWGANVVAQAPVAGSEMTIVPYDPTKPVAQQKPDQFYLPYERFLELWQAAKENRRDPQPEPSAVPYVLSSARYEGVLGERVMTVTGRLDLTTYNESWVEVPLAFKNIKISALQIDGVAAAFNGARIIVEKAGRHRVEIAFEIPLGQAAQSLEWGIPQTGATLLRLTLPDDRTQATVTPGSGSVEQTIDGRKQITTALGPTNRVRVDWKTVAAVARIAEPALAVVRTQIVTRIGREESLSEFAFTFPGARQDRFTVYAEKGLTLTSLGAANVKSWRLSADAGRQALEIVLHEPVEETYQFQITTERPLAPLPVDVKAPMFSAAARRVEFSGMALCAGERIELTPRPAVGQRQIPWDRPPGLGDRVVAAYAGPGQPGYRVALRESQREARVDYVYQVNRRKIELIASLQLFARGDDLSSVTMSLPAQFAVQAIESERLQDWWREGDTLHLRFRGATPPRTPLVVYLVRQYSAAPTELDVRPLVLDGFKKVEGEAIVAAHKGVEATIKISADAREMAPELAATDFQILPPLERKRGFAFKNQAFAAQVSLAALPARTAALWVMHAQAHEGWVAVSTHARLTMRQGSIDRVAFALPAATAEARVSGAEVRETRSRVEGDRRIYEVQFQNDVYESVEFTLDLELPNPGAVALPVLSFPEAQLTSGFVIADNASEYEMKLKTSGVDPAPAAEIPFLPELTKSAEIFRVQANWSVAIAVERLEKATARAAFVAWAELTTALRDDGTEWHRATYRLQNRSLQFLPVKMPPGAELVSVRVAGQSVRADAGKIGATAAVLVPLIKTKPGDLSYDVELVYRVNAQALGWWTRRGLDDPELLGITVERTFWNVWLPEDRKLQSASGNMEAVLAEVNKADKLEGSLQELKSLVSIANSADVSLDARQAAVANIGRLQNEIERDNRDENFTQSYEIVRKSGKDPGPTPAEETVGKKGIAQQGAYVASKRREISDQLGQEVRKLTDTNINNGVLTANATANPPPAPDGSRMGHNAINANTLTLSASNAGGLDQNNGFPQANPGSEKWQSNGAFSQKGKPATPPVPAVGGNNFYFNDNVVLQQKPVAPESKTPPIKDNKKAVPPPGNNARLTISGGKNEYSMTIPQQAEPLFPPAASAEPAEKKSQDSALNTARGNSVRYQEEQQAQQARQPQTPPPASRELPKLNNQAPATILPNAAAASLANAASSVISFANIAPGNGATSSDAEAQRLPTAGRISLAVDFPTEGQLYHFKKVKANAQLALTLIAPESYARWPYLTAALALAALLTWLQRYATPGRPASHPF